MFCDLKLYIKSYVFGCTAAPANGFADRKVNRHFTALHAHGVRHRVGVNGWTKFGKAKCTSELFGKLRFVVQMMYAWCFVFCC